MKDILILINQEGKIVKINRQAEKASWIREEELLKTADRTICRDEEVVQ